MIKTFYRLDRQTDRLVSDRHYMTVLDRQTDRRDMTVHDRQLRLDRHFRQTDMTVFRQTSTTRQTGFFRQTGQIYFLTDMTDRQTDRLDRHLIRQTDRTDIDRQT